MGPTSRATGRTVSVRTGVLTLTALMATAGAVRAQNPSNMEFRVNTYTTGTQRFGSIAGSMTYLFVVTWESAGQDGSGEGLFGRLLSTRGEPMGEEFAVNTHTVGNQDTPAVAGFAAGGFVAVWEDLDQDDDGETVMAQRFDAAGGRMGAEFRVNGGTVGDQYEPAVTTHEAGFVVAWASASAVGGDGSGAGIVARRFDLQGVALGDDIQVNTYTTGDQTHPALAAAPGGGFVVAWASDGQDGAAEGIFAQRFDGEGARLGEEFQVNTYTTGVQLWPALAVSGAGAFLVVWESAGQDGSSDAVMGRLFGANGAARGPEGRINAITAGAQEDAAVAADGRGGFLVVWESADGSSDGVSGRRCGGWPRLPR